MTRIQRKRLGYLLLAGALPTHACGGNDSAPIEAESGRPELTGTELVVGSTLEEWGILVLDRAGGPVSWRPLRDPTQVVWDGASRVGPFEEARPAGGPAVALRSADGTVSLYDPVTDSARPLGELPGDDVRWTVSDLGAVLSEPASGRVLAVLPDRAWSYQAAGAVDWAGAVQDGIAVLGPGPELSLVPQGADAPVDGAPAEIATPGLVMAWGRRLAFVDASDASALRVLTVDPPETAGRVELSGAVSALAASPSSHQLYAGIADPAGIEVVNRFSFTTRPLTALERAPVSLRPSLFGEYLLAYDGSRIWRVTASGGRPVPIPGRWDADLPLGLPDGRVLSRTADGEVSLLDSDGRPGPDSIETRPGTVWLAVRWVPSVRAESDTLDERPIAVSPGRPAPAARQQPDEDRPRPGEETGREEEPETGAAEDPGVPPGYYAIVGSARQRPGIDALVADLGTAGFPVQVQVVTDRAGENWYRGLVGPFASRAEAEAAARQLQRERQLQSWVTGIQAHD